MGTKTVSYNQMINENTETNYLNLLNSPGWLGFNYRRPENINKLGILYTNLSLQKPVYLHFFFPGYVLLQVLNSLFLGFGILLPSLQVISTLLLQLIGLGLFVLPHTFKSKLIYIVQLVLHILFIIVTLGPFMLYIDHSRDLSNLVGKPFL